MKTSQEKSVYILEICGTFPVSGVICNDRTGRIRENPWVIAAAGNLRINSVASDENVPRKICVYPWNLWDFSSLRGYLQRPDRSPPRNSVSNRLSRKSPNKFRVIRWIKNPMMKKICVICEICVTKKQIYTDVSPRFYTFYLVISLFNHTFPL